MQSPISEVHSKCAQDPRDVEMNLSSLHSELMAYEAAYTELQSEAIRKNGGSSKRKSPRSKQAVMKEQEELEKKTRLEVDLLINDHHRRLPRSKADTIGGLYGRYSCRFQSSIADQVRELLNRAEAEGIFVPRENVFYDMAVRGWKDRRPGLSRLKEAADAKKLKALLLFSTSRLYRRSYKAMEFVEERLVASGIRAIFVSSNLDTDDGENWRSMLQILGVVDEAQVRMMAAQIQSAQAGLALRRIVHGTIPLGYTGDPIPGELTRLKRPRRQIIVDPETAVWIVRINRWFLVDGLNIEEIARELNADPEAPAPAKSVLDRWTRNSVIAALTNRRYRGDWSYGNTESVWLSDKDYSCQISREEPLQEAQFEELRIISDEVWFEVQKRLSTDPKRSGRKPCNRARRKHSRLLQGKFQCPEHGRRLAVTGDGGKVMLCPVCRGYKVEQRSLFTHLNRKLATDLTCERLASLFDDETVLVTNVIEICGAQASTYCAPDPVTAQNLQSQVDKLRRTIKFNRQDPGESEMEQQQTRELLRDLRHQLAEAESALSAHQATAGRNMVIPTEDEILAEVRQLRQTLHDAPKLTDDRQIRLVRRLIDDLVSGKIQLYQQGERKKCFGWLQGRFEVAVLPFLIKRLTGSEIGISDEDRAEIVIDYRKSELIAEQADTAKRLWDDGLLCKEIAVQMGLHPSRITKVLQYWHDQRGLPCPNNKTRRKRLENKQCELPSYKRIANDVIVLTDSGHSNLEIARRLRTNDYNVAKAIQWWHESRGLPVPTASDRRRQKLTRAKLMLDEGMLIKDVAGELGYSPRGLKLALEKDAKDSGGMMVDGRTRRGNATAGNLTNGASEAAQTRAA